MQIALVGCGGMGLRHTHGIAEQRAKFGGFDFVAVCDRHIEAARHVAGEAESLMGRRPAVYTDFREMVDREKGLDAVDIVTDTRMHHVFAIAALEAGLNVITEKPMGITLRACRRMAEAAAKSGKTLAVAENFRRDPMNRLARALLQAGAIGSPFFLMDIGIEAGGANLMHNTGWRALRSRAGSLILERGVHDADLILYFMGDVETVYASTAVYQKVRRRGKISSSLARFYSHRVEDQFGEQEEVTIDAEDTALGVVTFKSGASGQITMSNAAQSHGVHVNTIHGSQGTISLPRSRSGSGPELRVAGRESPLTGDEILALVPEWELDDVTSILWDGARRLASYEMSFPETDRKIIAIELQDFAEAIQHGRPPEVDAAIGMKALALAYGLLESGHTRRAVSMDEVLSGVVEEYQDEINADAGIK